MAHASEAPREVAMAAFSHFMDTACCQYQLALPCRCCQGL